MSEKIKEIEFAADRCMDLMGNGYYKQTIDIINKKPAVINYLTGEELSKCVEYAKKETEDVSRKDLRTFKKNIELKIFGPNKK